MDEGTKSTRETIDRHYPLAGLGILVLSAANWLTSTRTEIKFDRDTSMWGVLAVINSRYEFALILAIVVITLAAVACLTFALHRSHTTVTVFSLLGATASALVMAFTDGGFTPGPGAWLTLILCVAAAVLSMISTHTHRDPTTLP